MGRPSPGSSWARLRILREAGASLVAISPLMHAIRAARVVETKSTGTGALHIAALRALQVNSRIEAAVKDGGEGVVTGTARVRHRDARRGRFGKQADPVRFTFPLRAGRHGALTLALAASGRTPTAADWTPVLSGGMTRVARQARTP
jgi:hypothetical protein